MDINAMNTMTEVLNFWFKQPMSDHWFNSTPEIDQLIIDTYEPLWEQAKKGELDSWAENPGGCLALCVILDQMPLNMFRGTAKSFSTEQQAVKIAKIAIANGLDNHISSDKVSFLYMPLMHSEDLNDQNLAVECFEKVALEGNLKFSKHHRGIIETYGRFPHRNEALGRESTQAEIDYLNSKSAFTG